MTEYMIVVGSSEKKDQTSVPYKLIAPNLKPGDTVTFIDYPASIGPSNSTPDPLDWAAGLDQSLTEGEAALRTAVEKTDNVPVLVCYSLGAYVVSNYLEKRAKEKRFNEEILAAILIANPRAPVNASRSGVAGPHGSFGGVEVVNVTNWNDMIASTPVTSILRKLTDFVRYTTGGLKDANSLYWVFIKNNILPTMNDFYQITGYLDGTQHVGAYFQPMFKDQIKKAMASF